MVNGGVRLPINIKLKSMLKSSEAAKIADEAIYEKTIGLSKRQLIELEPVIKKAAEEGCKLIYVDSNLVNNATQEALMMLGYSTKDYFGGYGESIYQVVIGW
jgi:hypothetical protein